MPASSDNVRLEDPFVIKADNTCPFLALDPFPTRKTDLGEDTDSDTTIAEPSGIFGYAPLYKKTSSAVKMPSSPASRKSTSYDALGRSSPPNHLRWPGSLAQPPSPQRSSSSFLNASAAPFQPRSTSPANHKVDRRNFTHPISVRDLSGQENHPVQGGNNAQSSEIGEVAFEQEGSLSPSTNPVQGILWQSSWPAQSAHAVCHPQASVPPDDIILTTVHDTNIITPPDRSHHRSLMQDKRRLAYSDEPFLYRQATLPLRTITPCPMGTNGTAQYTPSRGRYLQPSPQHYTSQSPNQLTSYTSLSMPQSGKKDSRFFASARSRIFHDHLRNNGMLNRVGQGSFQGDQNGDTPQPTVFDHYTPTPPVPTPNHSGPQAHINPYSQDGNAIGSGAYFPGSTNYPQQVFATLDLYASQLLTSPKATAPPLCCTTASSRP